MAKMKKIIHAGSLVIETLYPRKSRHDEPEVRQAKQKASSEAQKRMNRIYSYQKLELMLAVNFPHPKDALVATLTFAPDHLPLSWKQADECLKYFRKLFSSKRSEMGQELVMFWSPEDDFGEGRYHYHVVINNTGDDYALLRKCWIYGSAVEFDPLQPDKKQKRKKDIHFFEALARYMTKEPPKRLGARSWSYTRNAKKPEIESFVVSEDTEIEAPEGATVLQDDAHTTDYASYRVVKYLTPGWSVSTVRAKRRRRKRAA
ncbi:MAG: hypothetical protein IJV41_00655 [Oscillospiraceae bacterium]|nr:hypothetical protein [Oscillospiraceae bacterium]